MSVWRNIKPSKWHGFTLVELLAAVAIVGVLVTLAMPRYKAFVARTRQAEAKNNLGLLNTLNEAYYLSTAHKAKMHWYEHRMDYGAAGHRCGSSLREGGNTLGFRLTDCSKARYSYSVLNPADGRGAYFGGDRATSHPLSPSVGGDAVRIYPGCDREDTWMFGRFHGVTWAGIVSEPGKLFNHNDVVSKCSE